MRTRGEHRVCQKCGARIWNDPEANGTDEDPFWAGWGREQGVVTYTCYDGQHEPVSELEWVLEKRGRLVPVRAR